MDPWTNITLWDKISSLCVSSSNNEIRLQHQLCCCWYTYTTDTTLTAQWDSADDAAVVLEKVSCCE